MLVFVFQPFSDAYGSDANYVTENEAPDDPRAVWRFVFSNIIGVGTIGVRERLKNKN